MVACAESALKWRCPGADNVWYCFARAGEDLYRVAARSHGAIGSHLHNVKEGLTECFDDSFSEVSRIVTVFTPAEGSVFREIASTSAVESRRFCDWAFPGFYPEALLLKISFVECVVYGIEVFCQPPVPFACWLEQIGAGFGPAIAVSGEWWRLLTPIFLHGNLNHLFMNAFIQMRLGFKIEKFLGASRFAVLYFGSGVIANFVSFSLDPVKLAVGASTSVFGVVGAGFAVYLLNWPILSTHHKIMAISYGVVISGLLIFSPMNVDVIGHGIGFLAGTCLMILLTPQDQWPEENNPTLLRAGAMMTLGACIATGAWGWAVCIENLSLLEGVAVC